MSAYTTFTEYESLKPGDKEVKLSGGKVTFLITEPDEKSITEILLAAELGSEEKGSKVRVVSLIRALPQLKKGVFPQCIKEPILTPEECSKIRFSDAFLILTTILELSGLSDTSDTEQFRKE